MIYELFQALRMFYGLVFTLHTPSSLHLHAKPRYLCRIKIYNVPFFVLPPAPLLPRFSVIASKFFLLCFSLPLCLSTPPPPACRHGRSPLTPVF